MPINYTFYVIVAVFAMFFGYFFGLIEGRMQGYKKRKKEEEKERETAPEAAPSSPSPAVEAPPAPLPLPPPSLLRLYQDENGQLGLDLDDQRVNMAALTGQQRKRLVELLTRMRPWLEVPKPPASTPTPQPASVSRPSPAPQPTPSPSPAPAVPPSRPAPKAVVPGPIVPIESPPEAPDSIVTQIDAILQARLLGTPLEDQGIKLRESPDGSVLVHVGSRVYQSVEEVPDEAIKVALRAAIAEWEKRYTPGL